MMKQVLVGSVVVASLSLAGGIVLSADQEQARETVRVQTQEQERIYGSQLMTEEERAEYRARMRATNTAEEREQIRKEHHELMKERAAAQGMTLPDEPPAVRGGMGSGGGGMGSGAGGMGSGGGGKGQGGGHGR